VTSLGTWGTRRTGGVRDTRGNSTDARDARWYQQHQSTKEFGGQNSGQDKRRAPELGWGAVGSYGLLLIIIFSPGADPCGLRRDAFHAADLLPPDSEVTEPVGGRRW